MKLYSTSDCQYVVLLLVVNGRKHIVKSLPGDVFDIKRKYVAIKQYKLLVDVFDNNINYFNNNRSFVVMYSTTIERVTRPLHIFKFARDRELTCDQRSARDEV